VFDQAVNAIHEAHRRGFRVNVNSTLFEGVDTERMANFFDHMMELDVEGITVSPGFSYERAPDQDHFLKRERTRQLFRDIFRHNRKRKWRFSHSSLFLDFLAGNQTYHCTPWGNPTRNIFGWQRPCYLLDEGYAGNFKELMEETDWQSYGTGNYEKCANCMAHCGYEATAVTDIVAKPWKAVILALRGIRTEGPMALDIALENARPAEYARDERVEIAMKEDAELKSRNSGGRKATICDAA
jgi:hopanoid biosynthesis associated radical SAM protein HpnH